jgi:hypothetical protein
MVSCAKQEYAASESTGVGGMDQAAPYPAEAKAGGAGMPERAAEPATTTVEAPQAGRMVIQTAEIVVRVENARKAQREAAKLAVGAGGFVQSSSITGLDSAATATLIIRLPAKGFEGVLDKFRSLGELVTDNTQGQDVTAQYADVMARLRVLRAEEVRLTELIGQANTIQQILTVRERLTTIREQIESMDAQRRTLADQAALSTVTLTLAERPSIKVEREPNWFRDTVADAYTGLQAAAIGLAKFVIRLVVYLPIWAPIVLIVWWLVRRLGRKQ